MTKLNLTLRAANRARRDNTRANSIIAAAKFGPAVEIEYVEDQHGDMVRVGGCERDEAVAYITGKRALERGELVEEIGEGWLKFWIKEGCLVQDKLNKRIFWFTTKAQERYNLPARTRCGMNIPYHPVTKN